jgi:hypothetical protein
MRRSTIDEILAAVIAEKPLRLEAIDVVAYIARVDGRWPFDKIAEGIGTDATNVLRGLNRVSIGVRRGDARNVTLLLERARRRLNGGKE